MAKRRQWTWVYSPPKPKVPDAVKAEVEAKAKETIDQVFKPKYIKRPPKDMRWNYLTGITSKWHRNYFYFIGVWASPGPNALSPGFESGFARLEYTAENKFNLSYMRHTEKWWEVHRGLTLDAALRLVRDDGLYHPPA
jgi:hypothetical protein